MEGQNPQDQDRRQTGLKIPTPWGPVEVRGLGTILSLSLVVLALVAYMTWEGKAEHAKIVTAVEGVKEVVAEQTYVLTLDQKEREALNLSMPPSLRSKIRKGEQ